jgi:hypothetical protein
MPLKSRTCPVLEYRTSEEARGLHLGVKSLVVQYSTVLYLTIQVSSRNLSPEPVLSVLYFED